jgi:hypothetical protein
LAKAAPENPRRGPLLMVWILSADSVRLSLE